MVEKEAYIRVHMICIQIGAPTELPSAAYITKSPCILSSNDLLNCALLAEHALCFLFPLHHGAILLRRERHQ